MTLQLATLDAPSAKPEIVNGRYRIPVDGKPKMHTRATTFAKSIADEYHLTRWKLRMSATGLVLRKDLYAAVASSMPVDLDAPTKDEKDRLNTLCEQAMDAAGSAKGSNLGTALHDFTDAVDSGRTITIPPPWDADVAAYRAVMDASPYAVERTYIEQVVVVPSLNVAGKFDRILRHTDGRLVIGDLKTAKGLDLGWGEIAIQLALYAHAETIFDPATGAHTPMPEVDQERALVMHLPVGQATCKLYEVDIAAGWEAAQLCLGVREWRKRRNLAEQINLVVGAEAGDPVHISQPLAVVNAELSTFSPDAFAGLPDENGKPQADRTAKRTWLLERRETLIAIPGGREALAGVWPADLPTLMASDQHTFDQLDQIAKLLSVAEKSVQAPFPRSEDPTDLRTIKVPGDDPRVVDLVARLGLLPPDLLAAVEAGAKKERVPNLTSGRLTEDRLDVISAIVASAEAEYAPRATIISNFLALAAEHNVSEAALCNLLGVASPRHIHGHLVELLIDVVGAIDHPARILVERDGALVVDQPAALFDAYGKDRRRVLAAGREAAKANGIEPPKDSDAALSHPLIAAVMAAI